MIAQTMPTYLDGQPKKLLIGGEWVPGSSGQTFPSFAAHSGERLADIAAAQPDDVDRAVASARAAFEGEWSRFSPADRQAVLLKLADLVDERFEEIALIDTLEMGRPITASRRMRSMVVRALRYFAGAATAIEGRTYRNSFPVDLQAYSLREPVGVVASIVPWNGPIFTAAWKTAPALAAGCTVIIKPSEEASLSPLLFGELCLEAGIPPGVVNVITGDGQVGAALSAHPGVDKVTFTGSCATGTRIIEASASTVKRVTMELGGKSPNIIFADADLERAAEISAAGIFNNSGQVCSAGSRLFIERSVYDEFLERMAAAARKFVVGSPLDEDTQIGPIVSGKQYQRVAHYLETGVKEGARLVAGGERLTGGVFDAGHYVPPTVFADVTDEMQIACDEIFGPVVCALPFDEFDEVITRANATVFGLAGGVWTQDITKAHRAVSRIRAGSIWVNHYQAMDPAVPFGGYKMSGYGREGSFEHLDGFLQTKSVWIYQG